MRALTFAVAGLAIFSGIIALVQAPSLLDPITSARPSHQPAVGMYVPMFDNAIASGPAIPQSVIDPIL